MQKASCPTPAVSPRWLLFIAALFAATPALPGGKLATAELTSGGKPIVVEVADEDASRRQGLMFRKRLPADRGMLFVWPDAERRSMWMKNTLIPLDVAFIDDRHRIVNIETMEPQTLVPHRAAQPVRFALEVNAGWFARHGVKPGDRIAGIDAASASVRDGDGRVRKTASPAVDEQRPEAD